MSTVVSDSPAMAVTVRPWPDPVLDRLGFDPRSPYAERFWLPTLGPSAMWFLRRLAAGLESEPAGFELEFDEAARSLGLSAKGGRHSPFVRTVTRCIQFHVLHHDEDEGLLLARRKLPALNRYQVSRLPDRLQRDHERWLESASEEAQNEHLRTRARRLALSLFELGEDAESTERQLARWRFHPVICREATAWALARHRESSSSEDALHAE